MFNFISEEGIEKYYSETENEHYFKPTEKQSFIYGIKYALLNVCKSLFEQLTQDEGIALHFCKNCKKVVFYGENDICNNCSQEFSHEFDTCPSCDSDNFTPLCSNCGHEIDCDYLSDLLYHDLADLEWINIDDLSTIKDYLLSVLNNR